MQNFPVNAPVSNRSFFYWLGGMSVKEMGGAGDGILAIFQLRARDLWTKGVWPCRSPDYESGALARLGYPGTSLSSVEARSQR